VKRVVTDTKEVMASIRSTTMNEFFIDIFNIFKIFCLGVGITTIILWII
jgi:hypothetical protein